MDNDVQIGDVFKSGEDEHKYGRDRRVRVTGFSEARGSSVLAEDIKTGRKTTVARARMRPGKLGWTLMERGGVRVGETRQDHGPLRVVEIDQTTGHAGLSANDGEGLSWIPLDVVAAMPLAEAATEKG